MVRMPVNTLSPGKSPRPGFSHKMRSAYFIIALPRHRDSIARCGRERKASVGLYTRIISRTRKITVTLDRGRAPSPFSGIVREGNKCSAIKDPCALPPTCGDLPRQVRCVLSRDFHYPAPDDAHFNGKKMQDPPCART